MCVATVLNDAIDRLQMDVSAILQSCTGKYQVMAKSTLCMYYLSPYKVF